MCDRQVDKERQNPLESYGSKVNPEISRGTHLYFQSKGVLNMNNLQKQLHGHKHKSTQIEHQITTKK